MNRGKWDSPRYREPAVFDNYIRLIEKIDGRAAAVRDGWGRHMACRKGCHACCRHIAVFPVEAAYLARALAALPASAAASVREAARRSVPDGPCPLLADGACRLYPARPVICRTQGLPLLVRRSGGVAVDFCPRNFSGVTRLPSDALTDLERLNAMLAAVNRHWLSLAAGCDRHPERVSIADALLKPPP